MGDADLTAERMRELIEAPVKEDSDMAAVIKLMSEDRPDGDGLRKIDFLSRFSEAQVASMTVHDAAIGLCTLPRDLLMTTAIFGRKLVSKDGKSREEYTQIASATMMSKRMGAFQRMFAARQEQPL